MDDGRWTMDDAMNKLRVRLTRHSALSTQYSLVAGGVVVLSTLVCWLSPYEVDYEVALLPMLVRKGWVMYRDIIDQHPPLLPALLGITTSGDTGPALHTV